jgi:hypothetical protein
VGKYYQDKWFKNQKLLRVISKAKLLAVVVALIKIQENVKDNKLLLDKKALLKLLKRLKEMIPQHKEVINYVDAKTH